MKFRCINTVKAVEKSSSVLNPVIMFSILNPDPVPSSSAVNPTPALDSSSISIADSIPPQYYELLDEFEKLYPPSIINPSAAATTSTVNPNPISNINPDPDSNLNPTSNELLKNLHQYLDDLNAVSEPKYSSKLYFCYKCKKKHSQKSGT